MAEHHHHLLGPSRLKHPAPQPSATLRAQPPLYTAARAPAITATKAEPIITEHDITRITDLGLGRGLDATNPTPWLNKSSFQVRPVSIDNIVGTEEGGSLQSYERVIESLYAHQANMKASITVPQSPVSLGLDTEASRCISNTRHVVGRKVINRTVSFSTSFSDTPTSNAQWNVPGVDKTRIRTLSVTPRSTTCTGPRHYDADIPFEERLCSWILERIQQRQELKSHSEDVPSSITGSVTVHVSITQPEEEEGSISASEAAEQRPSVDQLLAGSCSSVEALAKYIRGSSHEEREEILQDCKDFVTHFHITHYVSAIELGAYEYRVMSETEYYAQVGSAGTFGFQSVATAAVSAKSSAKKKKKTSETKTIGTIQPDGTVVRGSYGEAVVGFQMLPISTLVKLRYLQMALQEALVSYINSTDGANTLGPFVIACDNDRLFLTVNQEKDYSVEATRDIKLASKFYVIPNDSSQPFEFLIAYYDENKPASQVEKSKTLANLADLSLMKSVPRYLKSDVSIMGTNPGPLKMEHQVTSNKARLVLCSRLTKVPIETRNWVNGKEIFYIHCSRRRLKAKSYLCVKESQPSLSRHYSLRNTLLSQSLSLSYQKKQKEYITACTPSIKSHNGHHILMLFRLLSANVLDGIMYATPLRSGSLPE